MTGASARYVRSPRSRKLHRRPTVSSSSRDSGTRSLEWPARGCEHPPCAVSEAPACDSALRRARRLVDWDLSMRESSITAPPRGDPFPSGITVAYVDPLGGRGGPPRSLAVLARNSAYRAHYLAAPGTFLEFARSHGDADSVIVELPSAFHQRWSKLRGAARCGVRIGAMNQRLIWVVNGMTGIWMTAPTARLRREPVVLIFRDSARPGRRARSAMEHWHRMGLRIFALAPSRYGLETLLQSVNIAPLGVVPNAVRSISTASRKLPTDTAPRVGWIGSRRRVKGLATLIKLAGSIPNLNVQWALFGSGLDRNESRFPYIDECRNLAQALGVSSRVDWRGYVDSERIMAEIDVLVVTSERESCSRVIIEALAAGIPVVATDVGGNAEILTGSLSAGLFERRDPSAGAGVVKRITTDPEYYGFMSQCALDRAGSFEARKIAALFDDALAAVVEDR